MPRSSEQFDKIRKQKKKLIIQTALELFAENGYHATSMSTIAKKASISKGLAYNYFKTKQDILDEIVKTGINSIYSHFDLNHDGILTEEEFEHFIKKSFKVIRENRRFWKLYSAILMQSDLADPIREKYGDISKSVFIMLRQFIISKGSKDPESDIMVISALLKGAQLLIIFAPDYFSSEKLEDKITEACLQLINKH